MRVTGANKSRALRIVLPRWRSMVLLQRPQGQTCQEIGRAEQSGVPPLLHHSVAGVRHLEGLVGGSLGLLVESRDSILMHLHGYY